MYGDRDPKILEKNKTLILLGGSWVVISRVISRVTIFITHIRGLITLLITTHEPPSRALGGTLTGALRRTLTGTL